jgi:hypothetical protein
MEKKHRMISGLWVCVNQIIKEGRKKECRIDE